VENVKMEGEKKGDEDNRRKTRNRRKRKLGK
jgi:hypothetical protein